MEVAGKPDYKMHFNLQSFMETLQTLDLEHWKVKLSKEREILDKVMKVVELKKKIKRTYIYELCDNIAETKRKRTVKMRNLERSFRSSDTFRLHLHKIS